MTTSVIIPAYNEERTIAGVVRAAREASCVTEVVVVDDGSQDHTAERARAAGATVVSLPERGGKGRALAAGVKASQGEVLIFLDADLINLKGSHVDTLARPVLAGRAQMALGVFVGGSWHTDLAQRLAPWLTGQRAMQRSTWPADLDISGYAVESALQKIIREEGLRVVWVQLQGVTQLTKEKKYGLRRGMRLRWAMYKEITCFYWQGSMRAALLSLTTGRLRLMLFLLLLLSSILYQGYNLMWARAEGKALGGISLDDIGPRVLVVAPHPDDEVLGAGGLLAVAMRDGSEVRVAWLTPGDGFRRGAEAWYDRRASQQDMQDYGRLRQQEAVNAVARLGVPAGNLYSLGYPDGGLAQLWWENWHAAAPYASRFTGQSAVWLEGSPSPGAPYAGEKLLTDLQQIMEEYRPTAIFVTSALDSNPDHWAAHSFVSMALQEVTRDAANYQPRLYSYIIHHGLWEVLPVLLRGRVLLPPARLLKTYLSAWTMWPLEPDILAMKRSALGEYRTQQKVMSTFLNNFLRPNEVFLAEQVRGWPLSLDYQERAMVLLPEPAGDGLASAPGGSGELTAVFVAASRQGLTLEVPRGRGKVPGLGYRLGVYKLPASPGGVVERHVVRVSATNGRLVEEAGGNSRLGQTRVERNGRTWLIDLPIQLNPGDELIIGGEKRLGFVTVSRTPWQLWQVQASGLEADAGLFAGEVAAGD